MKTSRVRFACDNLLPPECSQEQGYKWVDDIVYDETVTLPADLVRDIQSFRDDGYKLGCMLYPISGYDKIVYEPVKNDI